MNNTFHSLRIIFAGTPEFAAAHLQTLVASEHQVIAVYTQPDRQAGRGRKITPSAVKVVAQEHAIPIYQPDNFKTSEAQDTFIALHADIMVVVAYGLLLPEIILNTPRLGCINVHASILPRWRGAAPIQRAILAGDTETGITIMQMDKGLDTGDILNITHCPITVQDNSQSLHDKLIQIGQPLLLDTLKQLANGTASPQRQVAEQANYAKKLHKAEALIDWQNTASQIQRQVAAFNPWPMAYTYWQGKMLRILAASVIIHTDNIDSHPPGYVLATHTKGIDIITGANILRIHQLQLAGKRPVEVKEFLNAYSLQGDCLQSTSSG